VSIADEPAGSDGAPALDHATVVASDLAASLDFYDAALGALGLLRAAEFGDEEEGDADVEAVGWAVPGSRPLLWVIAGSSPTRGAHLSLVAAARADVERFHAAALAAGGTSRTAPRRWPIFRRGEFSAAAADPDGNLLEVRAPE
jgi:catechol 2,3-dioxygenase-like lactoylglutathione lyase family enzyme